MTRSRTANRALLLCVMLLVGCDRPSDAKLLCSSEAQAYLVEWETYRVVVRRLPAADQLCHRQ